ncbi:hypothetical protein like AT3G19920 [Hibiscus trionum]|uniref:At3g05675-like ankyrin-like domain-containing protein n=1 Tax=Hibiscus trionum TaxID=183268 RepID=A0A9W7HC44_HIBTR|nr:hypothetical protein like AT3G19920 [Hibiscus trionum]
MATGLDRLYDCIARPSSLLNSIFMSTVNMAAKMLVSVASSSKAENTEKWKLTDHLRFMVMLITWVMLWALRFLMDLFPCSLSSSPDYLLGGSSSVGPFQVAPYSSAGAEAEALSSSGSSLDLILRNSVDDDGPAVKALVKSLTHVLALLSEIPASSRKYQFTMAMADKIMEDNARHGHGALLHVNRTALASSFTRTSTLLHRCLQLQTSPSGDYGDSWHMRAIKAIPFGSYVASYVKAIAMCLNAAFSLFDTGTVRYRGRDCSGDREIMTEKLAQELLWVTNKLGCYGDVNEALVQWSLASGLASLSLTASPRVQGSIVKISAFLFGELTRKDLAIARQVKFRLLVLWIPLFCHASNGHAYPILTSFQKAEIERTMDEVISSFPARDQEVLLTNWLENYAVSVSDWPNLGLAYDRWCRSTRESCA